jgi:hypothetical protein
VRSVYLSFSLLKVPLNNHIPERAGPESRVPTEAKDLEENEVVPKRSSSFDGDEDVPNRVSMSSTAQGSNIFERTEVLAGKDPCFSLTSLEGGRKACRQGCPWPIRLLWALKNDTSLKGQL